MLWLFIIGVLLASIWLEAYLRRRRNGQADGDWTFLQNRCALAAGGVAAVLIAPNLGCSAISDSRCQPRCWLGDISGFATACSR
jgi:hypothetical protein